MDEDNKDPSEINRKRKLEAEQLDLPLPKHKCCAHHLSSEPLPELKINSAVEDLYAQIIKENAERVALDENPEVGSAKGSNSFRGDSDSSLSIHGEAMIESEIEVIWSCDRPTTSSYNLVNTSLKKPYCFSESMDISDIDAGKQKQGFLGGELDPYNDYYGLEGFPFLEYGTDRNELCADEDMENIFHSKEANPNIFVLSSGRWSVNQEAKQGTRKPTIDQEFEQYFSTLML